MDFVYPIEIDSEVVSLSIDINKHGEWDARAEINGTEMSIYERLTEAEEADIQRLVTVYLVERSR